MQRRSLLTAAALGGVGLALSPLMVPSARAAASPEALPMNEGEYKRYRPPYRFGLGGGVGLGDSRRESELEHATAIMQAAWDVGVRLFDTSPWYGLGLSERRMGHFLFAQEPDSLCCQARPAGS